MQLELDSQSQKIITESRRLAAIGVAKAKEGKLEEALKLFDSAIWLYDKDYRYYVNRGYCLITVGEHQRALADLIIGLSLEPSSYKCRFLKARALCGLKMFSEAEKEFLKLLENKACFNETHAQLMNTRFLAVTDRGYSEKIALSAANKSNSIEEALKKAQQALIASLKLHHQNSLSDSEITVSSDEHPLAAGKALEDTGMVPQDDIYSSDEDQQKRNPISAVTSRFSFGQHNLVTFRCPSLGENIREACAALRQIQECDYLEAPTNLLGFKAIYVANISPQVDHNYLASIFKKYGTVLNIVILKTTDDEPARVIVNYDNVESPVRAVADYYQRLFTDVRLSPKSLPLSFKFTLSEQQREEGFITAQEAYEITKENEECFFWRAMSGCGKRRSCELRHIRINRGIDTHPWKLPAASKCATENKNTF